MRAFPLTPCRVAVLVVVTALHTGCSMLLGTRNEPPRLYVLTAEPVANAGDASAASGLTLGFGPVRMPGYLDRQGIVTRVSATRLEASRNDLWAEPIGVNFRDVLASDLRSRLPGAVLRSYPWGAASSDLAVSVEVTRFEATSAGVAELHARWTLKGADGKTVLLIRESLLSQPIAGAGTDAAVAALSQAVAALSDEIAVEVTRRAAALPAARRASS